MFVVLRENVTTLQASYRHAAKSVNILGESQTQSDTVVNPPRRFLKSPRRIDNCIRGSPRIFTS